MGEKSEKPEKKKKGVTLEGRPEDSNLAKTLQEFSAQKNRGSAHLWMDKEVYAEAKRIFGPKKVGAIVEAALKDLIDEWKQQNGLSENKKPEE